MRLAILASDESQPMFIPVCQLPHQISSKLVQPARKKVANINPLMITWQTIDFLLLEPRGFGYL